MRLKIRCDGKCEKICKIFWEVNQAQIRARSRKRKNNEYNRTVRTHIFGLAQ